MKKPNIYYIGIGGSRSATFWISECLREHPELDMAQPNELHFFSHSGEKSNYEIEGIEGYYKKFKITKKKTGEFSPNYLTDNSVPKTIKKHFPNIKILVSLRNPVERYQSERSHFKNFEKIENIIPKEDSVDRGMYFKHLSKYYKTFPRKNIKVVLVDEIKKEPLKTIQGIYKFLGVKSDFVPSVTNKQVNKSSKQKYETLAKVRERGSELATYLKKHNLFLLNLLRALKINKLSWLIWEKNRIEIKADEISQEEKKELLKRYTPDIKKLEKLTKKDLSKWKKLKN